MAAGTAAVLRYRRRPDTSKSVTNDYKGNADVTLSGEPAQADNGPRKGNVGVTLITPQTPY